MNTSAFKNPAHTKESYDLITKNLFVTSDEIPDYLMNHWINWSGETNFNEDKDQVEWVIFIFAFVLYNQKKGKTKFNMSIEKLEETFQSWQAILMFFQMSRMEDMETIPVKIFDFDNYDKMILEGNKRTT